MPSMSRRRSSPSSARGATPASFRPSSRTSTRPAAGGAGTGSSGWGEAAEENAVVPAAWDAVTAGRELLRQGSRGEAVRHLQQLLADQGANITADGIFGRGTKAAVQAWQRARGLSADGVVGPSTARAMAGGGTATTHTAADTGGDSTHRSGGPASTSDRTVAGIDISPAHFENTGLRAGVFAKALDAFAVAFAEGQSDSTIVTVIDYELPSSERRFWVIDLERKQLLFHEYTSHGSGSDRDHDGRADRMSNVPESGTSNVGLLRSAETYHGKHGYSMRMDGLERGFNHNARRRAVVVHSASYVDDRYIARNGKAGRSLGCPALDPDVSGRIIDTIKGGKLIFAYYPDQRWLRESRYLNQGGNS